MCDINLSIFFPELYAPCEVVRLELSPGRAGAAPGGQTRSRKQASWGGRAFGCPAKAGNLVDMLELIMEE